MSNYVRLFYVDDIIIHARNSNTLGMLWDPVAFSWMITSDFSQYFYKCFSLKFYKCSQGHYSNVMMSRMASQITSLTGVYSTVYSGADQRKHQSSASLAFVREIHRWAVNSHHKGSVTRKMFPFDDVIMVKRIHVCMHKVVDWIDTVQFHTKPLSELMKEYC